jgi:hypothetical protein
MVKTARTNPATFFAVCARLIPSDVKLTVEQTYGGLQAEDYGVLKAIREAIPDANNQSPQAVLEYVRDTLRAAPAKPIDCSKNTQNTNSSICSGKILNDLKGRFYSLMAKRRT